MIRFQFVYKAEIPSIVKLQGKLQQLIKEAGVPDDVVWALSLAAEEIMSNIIFYGYGNDSKQVGKIFVEVKLMKSIVRLSFTDQAKPFNPLKVRKPNIKETLDKRKPGGLGIHFVKTLMDRVFYKALENGNQLILEKKFKAGVK